MVAGWGRILKVGAIRKTNRIKSMKRNNSNWNWSCSSTLKTLMEYNSKRNLQGHNKKNNVIKSKSWLLMKTLMITYSAPTYRNTRRYGSICYVS